MMMSYFKCTTDAVGKRTNCTNGATAWCLYEYFVQKTEHILDREGRLRV